MRAAHYLGAYSSWKMILSSVNSLSTLCARRPLRVPADGDEALACCKRRVAEVLITDIRLPGKIDGWQIAKRCREHHPELRYRWS